jgi:hypothetical protein
VQEQKGRKGVTRQFVFAARSAEICEEIEPLCTGEYIGACPARVPDPPEKQAKARTTMRDGKQLPTMMFTLGT